jgi:hypothetical protein
MIVEVLTANTGPRVGVGIVAPAENASARYVAREEIAEPVDAVLGRPRPGPVAVEAMDGDDATQLRELAGKR